MRWLVGAAAGLALGACGAELPSPSSVEAPRFIALLTDTPEVLAGQGFAVRAVWFDPMGRAPTFRWRWCWDSGADPLRCADGFAAQTLASASAEVTVERGGLGDAPTGARGVIVMVRGEVGGDAVEAFRRIAIRAEGPLAVPPEIVRVRVEQGDAAVEVVEGVSLDVEAGPLRVELLPSAVSDAGLTASFLTRGGRFDPPRVVGVGPLSSRWSAEGPGIYPMWVVLRDERGGVSLRAWALRRAR